MKLYYKNIYFKKFCIGTLLCFLFLALLAPFIASENEIMAINNRSEFFLFPSHPIDSVVFSIAAPIPFDPENIDIKNVGAVGPLEEQNQVSAYQRHWLGTDLIGRDVLSSIIHGSRTSLSIGFASTIIAGFLGILIGGLAGYFGNSGLKISRIRWCILFFSTLFLLLYFIQLQKYNWLIEKSLLSSLLLSVSQLSIIIALLLVINLILKKIENKSRWKKTALRLDDYLNRLIEIVSTLPLLFIIISLTAIVNPSIWNVVLIIGFTGWTGIARFTRAEFLSLRAQDFVLSAKSLGLSSRKIFFRHLLPNAYPSIFTALTFSFAGVILAETTLSFLGIGLPPEQVSWGSLLAMARQQPEAWWLYVFPSTCIFLVIFSLHYLANYYSNLSRRNQ